MEDITVKRTTFKGRKGMRIQNDIIQLVMLQGGGHIADISFKDDKVNPLWIPKWDSMEPSSYKPEDHEETYGGPDAAKLLCAIMGHNICLDFFGAPSKEECEKGITTHGEAPILKWNLNGDDSVLAGEVDLPEANLGFSRTVSLTPGSKIISISETVQNKNDTPHKFGWCQHVTLGEPFLMKGETVFDMPAGWGRTISSDFGDHPRLEADRDFIWPTAPGSDGKNRNLRFIATEDKSGDFSTQLMDQNAEYAWFTAYSPDLELLIGYIWKSSDFPWIGNWEENFARESSPWNGVELTRGMEFSTSPFPDGRDAAIEMEQLHGVPTYRTIEPEGSADVKYYAFIERGLNGFQGTDFLEFTGEKVIITSGNKTIEVE